MTCRAASSRWFLLLVHYPGHASYRVAADPDVVINLADVDPATPTDGGSSLTRRALRPRARKPVGSRNYERGPEVCAGWA